jgi:hypothetical protein
LIQQLVEAGHPVAVGINPVCVDWLPDYEPLIDRIKELGVFGVWFSALYFGRTFGESLTQEKVDRITPELIDRAGCRGSKIDHAHITAAVEYAEAAGLATYYHASDRPSTLFDWWDQVYGKTMPMIQQLINQAHEWYIGEQEDYIVIQKHEAIAAMSELPAGFNYGPFFHSDVKQFRMMAGLPAGASLPKLNAEHFWDFLWNSEYFSAKMGPLSCRCFAYASVKFGKDITPIYDGEDRVMVYRPGGFKHRYAHTPDLAE